MASSADKLTPLQRETLRAFFRNERGFYLTGGAALAGFHLRHRETNDLDFFTPDEDAFERGRHALEAAAESVGAALVVRQHAPGFQRYVLTRGEEGLVVDLVWDRSWQVHEEKPERDGIRLDPPDEILANKLTTLLSRAEERDLVDVLLLERAGLSVEEALPAALAKDGGCTPAALAFVLSQVRIPEGIELPGAVHPAELRTYVEDLVRRLRRAAAPA